MEGNMFWNMDEVNWISWPSPENPFIIKRGACKNCFSYVTCLFSADFTSLAITYWETLKKKEIEIQSNLAIRNFLVALKLFLDAKSSLSLWSKCQIVYRKWSLNTIKLANKERFDKEKIGIKGPFPVTNLTFTS